MTTYPTGASEINEMANETPNIKIYISGHADSYVPHLNTFYPIRVGAASGGDVPDGWLRDDTGENISSKNESYCELTAQYWAWKNDSADYYGFFHYRRYFSFSEQHFRANPFGEVHEPFNDGETLKKYKIDDATIIDTVKKYDIVIPDEGGFSEKNLTLYRQYCISTVQHASDLDFVLDIIRRDYPQMYPYAKRYLNRTHGYFCNMFIMKRELFCKYCEWLFDILEKHERAVDISDYSKQARRVHGYLAERLCGIYLYYLEKTSDVKILKLQRVYFENTDREQDILPAFEKDNVAAVFSANDLYAPYLSALLQSVKEHSSAEHNYDLLVLHKDISETNRRKLQKQVCGENISLRFINVKRRMTKYKNLPLRGHFREETYFRLLLPDLLPRYDKILYLDSDMIVCEDIAELYAENVENYLLAACKDADTAGLYNGYEPNKKNYMDNVLKIKKPYEYFQAGTILFNLNMFRKNYTVEEVMRFAMSYPWELLDQDVLNYLAQGKTKFIGMEWNVMVDWRGIRIKEIIGRAPHYLYDEYMRARKAPKIIHYAGPAKPWHSPSFDFADIFWDHARRTPYYETALMRMMTLQTANIKRKKKRSLLETWMRSVANVFFPVGTKRRNKLKKFLKIK